MKGRGTRKMEGISEKSGLKGSSSAEFAHHGQKCQTLVPFWAELVPGSCREGHGLQQPRQSQKGWWLEVAADCIPTAETSLLFG